ncbi:type VII toxin-antitoxin system HepT family RNase toxin [Peribacillus simplex]|uniref:type VII toxin-antitoxin system HepT family RNase toxin n=1 Tax=Peribacillus simplex TaxID=1478 RepID=UPI003D2C5B0E
MKLRLPQTSRDDFDMLYAALIIDENTVKQLRAIVGFRNIAVHDYQTVNIDILQQIVVNHLGDFSDYTKQILKF